MKFVLTLIITTVLACPTAVVSAADPRWMPDEAKLLAARGMLARMSELGVPMDGSETDQLAGAIQAISGMANRIDAWGLENIINEIPTVTGIPTPRMPDPYVQAIAGYAVCGISVHPELADGENEKAFMVAAEFSVYILSGFLRAQYLAAGGTDEELKNHLTAPKMEAFSRQIQTTQEQISANLEYCQPFFLKVIGSAQEPK